MATTGTPEPTAHLPELLVDTNELAVSDEAAGAIWRLQVPDRDLDANVIALPAGDSIEAHTGPDLDVLVHILHGSGRVVTEQGDFPVAAGALVFLPRGSQRGFIAGQAGLRYLTVHRKRRALVIQSASTPQQ